MWGISDWFSGNSRSKHWTDPQAGRVHRCLNSMPPNRNIYFDILISRLISLMRTDAKFNIGSKQNQISL